MKLYAAAVALTLSLAGCVTAAEVDKSQAWAECEKILDRASQSTCMTKALADSNADRRAEAARTEKEFNEGAKAIEDKTAIERAMGAPEDQTGTTIVREPFE